MPPKILLLVTALLLAGCQGAPRAIVNTTSAAAGAVVAREASHGNPYWTAGGALTAYLVADASQSLQEKNQKQELALAFERGRVQSAQQAYDAIQNAQKPTRRDATTGQADKGYSEIPIIVPKRSINGVILNESVEYVRLSTH
jgi:hypothetical protein